MDFWAGWMDGWMDDEMKADERWTFPAIIPY